MPSFPSLGLDVRFSVCHRLGDEVSIKVSMKKAKYSLLLHHLIDAAHHDRIHGSTNRNRSVSNPEQRGVDRRAFRSTAARNRLHSAWEGRQSLNGFSLSGWQVQQGMISNNQTDFSFSRIKHKKPPKTTEKVENNTFWYDFSSNSRGFCSYFNVLKRFLVQ